MDRSLIDRTESQSGRGGSGGRPYRAWAGTALAALLGAAFILIGLGHLLAGGAGLHFERLFGLRDAFLGAFTLVLLVARQRRALFLLLAFALVLPVADTIALAGPDGLARAAGGNLPAELPLLLAAILLAPWGPGSD